MFTDQQVVFNSLWTCVDAPQDHAAVASRLIDLPLMHFLETQKASTCLLMLLAGT